VVVQNVSIKVLYADILMYLILRVISCVINVIYLNQYTTQSCIVLVNPRSKFVLGSDWIVNMKFCFKKKYVKLDKICPEVCFKCSEFEFKLCENRHMYSDCEYDIKSYYNINCRLHNTVPMYKFCSMWKGYMII